MFKVANNKVLVWLARCDLDWLKQLWKLAEVVEFFGGDTLLRYLTFSLSSQS